MGGQSSTPVVKSELEKKSGKATLDIAITGISGAGKSSLVNALRGLSDFDEAAATTDVIEGTTEPVDYPHPTFPDVIIWDLPGIGTPNFKAVEYLERVNYSQYDFFIIVASNRFTIYDIQLSHEIQKMKKPFYYVWSKMDISISNEKLNPDFNEETTLQRVRKYCIDNLVEAGISSPKIFLISSWFHEKYDFPFLKIILENEMEALRRSILRPADRSTKPSKGSEILFIRKTLIIDLAKLKEALMNRTLEDVAEEMRQELDELQNVKLDITITGVSGAERFTENDILLDQAILKMKKKFYFVRSKMDDSIAAEIRDPNLNLDKSIQKICKGYCYELTEAGESNPRVEDAENVRRKATEP